MKPEPPDRDVAELGRQVAALARRLKSEADEATVLCDRFLAGPSAWWAQRIRTSRRAQTTGVVERLIERTRTTLSASPELAELLSGIAMELAFAIDSESYPEHVVQRVRGRALREHAYVLSYRGMRTEALSFAERAQKLFDAIPYNDYEQARLDLVKASILQSTNRTEEAVNLVREAGSTFLRFGDRARWLDTRMWQGILLYNAGAVDRAYAIWQPLEEDEQMTHLGRAQLAHNLALCLADLGQHEAAIPYLYNCATQFDILGMPMEVTRSRAVLGRSLVAAGRPLQAIPILESAASQFAAHGMVMDAGLVRLELVEALLAAHQPRTVAEICREAIADFTRAGAAKYAATALNYIREAAALTPAAPALVREARVSLKKLTAEPPALFVERLLE